MINTWSQFSKQVRSEGCHLLRCLVKFRQPVLVTGCQRSGTTLLARVIRHSKGFNDFQIGKDDELDGALILSGLAACEGTGRYCFQTTYLNECYHEYYLFQDRVKLVWVLRNPVAVVWSMVNNWKHFALNELYNACGTKYHKLSVRGEGLGWLRRFFGGPDQLTKACLAYKGKTEQLFELSREISTKNLIIVEYEDIVLKPAEMLPKIFRFIDEPYLPEYMSVIHDRSLTKHQTFKPAQRAKIKEHCGAVYIQAKELVLAHEMRQE